MRKLYKKYTKSKVLVLSSVSVFSAELFDELLDNMNLIISAVIDVFAPVSHKIEMQTERTMVKDKNGSSSEKKV